MKVKFVSMIVTEPEAQGTKPLPEHLIELAAQSTIGLDGNECEKEEWLLVEYQDIFSNGEFDIGRMTLR